MNLVNKYKAINPHVKASIWFLICGFINQGISIITTPIFTRLLSTAEYGKYSVFNSWYGILSVLITLNLFSGVFTQGMVKFEERSKQFASSIQGLCFCLTLIWFIVYQVSADFWNNLTGLSTVQMYAMLFIIWSGAVFQFWSVEQRVKLKYRTLVVITILMAICKPGIGIYLVLHAEDKVTARILGLALVNIIYIPFFFIHIINGKKFFHAKFWKYALLFNVPLIPHYLSMTVLNSADRIMIGAMCGSSEAGIYNLAYSLSQVMSVFNLAFLQTIEPWLYRKIKENQVHAISKVAYPAILCIAILNMLMMLFAPELLSIFAPNSYGAAKWVIPPVSMSVFFTFLYTFFAVFEFYYESTKYVMVASFVGAITNIVLNWIFIKQYGFLAAGYTTLFCYILFAVFHYTFMRKMCNKYLAGVKPYSSKFLLGISIAVLAAGLVTLVSYNYNYFRYLIIALIALVFIVLRKKIIKMVIDLVVTSRNNN